MKDDVGLVEEICTLHNVDYRVFISQSGSCEYSFYAPLGDLPDSFDGNLPIHL